MKNAERLFAYTDARQRFPTHALVAAGFEGEDAPDEDHPPQTDALKKDQLMDILELVN